MEAPIIKKGRGRPRKQPLPPVISEPEDPEPVQPVEIPEIPMDVPQMQVVDEPELVQMASIPEEPDFETTCPEMPAIPAQVPYVVPVVPYFAPTPVQMEDQNERRQLLDKIKKYRQNFEAARALQFHEDMSTENLKTLLDDIRLNISSRNTSMIFRSGYLTAVKGVEIVGTKGGLRCYGLADALGKSSEVDQILKEIEAEVGIKYVSPWKRLAFITVSTAVVLDGLNRRAEMLAGFKSEPVNAVINDKYKDL